MSDQETNVAVMLVDVSGSTALYESAGNARALDQVSSCLQVLRGIIAARDGRFIHSKGDDVLCTFQSAGNALAAAIEMLESVRDGSLSVHAGIDFGPVIPARNDVFGDSVNMAARLAALANSGEVLCSQALFDRLDDNGRAQLRFFDARHFKGKADRTNVYSYADAEPGQETQLVFADSSARVKKKADEERDNESSVILRFRGRSFTCTAQRDLSIGRSADCDIVVSKPWVSRAHAALQIRQDHVYLKDTSTSGTYICFDGQDPILARRETVLLTGPCRLSPAKSPAEGDAELIECDVNIVRSS